MSSVKNLKFNVSSLRLNLGFLIVGYYMMVIYSYFDNIRGPLLPIFAKDLTLSYSQTSVFLVSGYLGSIVTSLLLLSALNRYSAKSITIFIASVITCCCLSSALVSGFVSLSLLGIVFGSFISIFSSMPNVFVVRSTPVHLQGKVLSGLQTMYGLGAIFVPWIAGYVTRNEIDWVWLFWITVPLMLIVIVYLSVLDERALALPSSQDVDLTPKKKQNVFSLTGMEVFGVAIFAIYVTGEVIGSMWMTTMLIEKYNHTVDSVKLYMTGYFVIFTLSRLSCFCFVSPKLEKFFIISAITGGFLSFVLVVLGYPVAFVFFGLVGPMYPVFLARICRNSPNKADAMAVWVLLGVQTVLSGAHFAVGKMLDVLGVRIAMFVPPSIMILTFILLLIYFSKEKLCRAA